MSRFAALSPFVVLAVLNCVAPAWSAQLPPEAAAADSCAALGKADFTHIADAPTRIYAAVRVPASGDAPAYCHVTGYVAPQVGFDLKLPADHWNNRLLGLGCGGLCGSAEVFFHLLTRWLPPLQQGFAVFGTDMGHRGVDSQDGLWAVDNPQGRIDYFHRATHVATLAAREIAAKFYGRPVTRAYFWGNSTGGRQALVEAQKYPADYDGVVARCPAIDPIGSVQLTYFSTTLSGAFRSHADNPSKIRVLADEVMRQCDALDGLADGVIQNPMACRPKLDALGCATGRKPDQCLAPGEIAAVESVYAGPMRADGTPVAGGLIPGSEADWIGRYLTGDGSESFYYKFMRDYFRYIAFEHPDPGYEPKDFNVDRDLPRLDWVRAMHFASNPDLRRYRDRGGKILMLQGWGDTSVMPGGTVDYYETVERTMGGPNATQDFMRLFMMPGVGHCDHGGLTGADVVDDLTALMKWVENGEAPARLLAWRLRSYEGSAYTPQKTPPNPDNIAFGRYLYPYPAVAVYRGTGDPTKADSFAPADPSGRGRRH
jgi:feruloyl esterase